MAKKNVSTIVIQGDSRSIEKALDNTAKRLERTRKASKKTETEVKDLGDAFSRTANQVTIFNGQLDPISGRLSAIGTGITRFGAGAVGASAAIGLLTIGVAKAVSGLETYEQRQNRFNALLQSTSYAARLTATDLEELSQATARATLGGVGEISESINALLTFRSVQGDIFKRTIALANDAKVAFGGNLREAVVAFGKALNDPIANLGALSRKGIQFTDAQEEMIQKLVESGDLIKAQGIILDELGNQFGGLAEKEAPELASSMDSLGQSISNMFESFGRTKSMTTFRDVLAQIVRGADRTAQSIADIHSEQAIELRQVEELEKAQDEAWQNLKKREQQLQEVVDKRAALFERAGGRVENSYDRQITQIQRWVNAAKKGYDETTKAFEDFIKKRKQAQEAERELQRQGIINTLNDELDALKGQAGELDKTLKKRRVSLVSAFENERDKVNRVFTTKTDEFKKAFETRLDFIDKIEKKQLAILSKSDAEQSEFDKVKSEREQERIRLREQYSDDIVKVEQEREAKLARIDKLEEDRLIAAENRAKRAAETAAREYRQELKIDFTAVETGAGGFQDFFGVNVDEQASKFTALETLTAEHLQKILDLNISHDEKMRRHAEIIKEYSIQQAELEKEGRLQAYADTWSALETLGASGSKKLFAIAKAANIARAVINTYTAASNAMAQVPYPFNFAAAATVAAAGFVQVRNIKNQPMPQFHDGIDYVPREGTYLLNQGERVLDDRLNADLTRYLGERNNGSPMQQPNINFSIQAGDVSGFDNWYENNRQSIINDIRYGMEQI